MTGHDTVDGDDEEKDAAGDAELGDGDAKEVKEQPVANEREGDDDGQRGEDGEVHDAAALTGLHTGREVGEDGDIADGVDDRQEQESVV